MKKIGYIICSGIIGLTVAQADILVDYNDGVAGGGHDTTLLAGDFTSAAGTWVGQAGPVQYNTSLPSGVGSVENYVAGLDAGVSRILAVDTGHAIAAGETYNLGFMWRDAFGWTADESISLVLFYTDDDTIGGIHTDFVTLNSAARTAAAAWETESATGLSGAGIVGKTLFAKVITEALAPAGGKYARVDNVFVEVVPEPATIGMVALFGTGLLIVRRKLMV